MDAAIETRHRERLDQILAMAMEMASGLEACKAEFEACKEVFRAAPPVFVADSRSTPTAVSAASLALPAASLIPSPTSAPSHDADPGFQSGITELCDTRDPPIFTNDDLAVLRIDSPNDPVTPPPLFSIPEVGMGAVTTNGSAERALASCGIYFATNDSAEQASTAALTPVLKYPRSITSTSAGSGAAAAMANRSMIDRLSCLSDSIVDTFPDVILCPPNRRHLGLSFHGFEGAVPSKLFDRPPSQALEFLIRPYDPGAGLVGGDCAGVYFDIREAEHAHVTFATGRLRRSACTWPADLRTGVDTMLDVVLVPRSPIGLQQQGCARLLLANNDPDGFFPAEAWTGTKSWLRRPRCWTTRQCPPSSASATITARVHTSARHLSDTFIQLAELQDVTRATPIGNLAFLSAMHTKCSMKGHDSNEVTTPSLCSFFMTVVAIEGTLHHKEYTEWLKILLLSFGSLAMSIPVVFMDWLEQPWPPPILVEILGSQVEISIIKLRQTPWPYFCSSCYLVEVQSKGHWTLVGFVSLDLCCSKGKMAWYYCLQFVLVTSSACASSPSMHTNVDMEKIEWESCCAYSIFNTLTSWFPFEVARAGESIVVHLHAACQNSCPWRGNDCADGFHLTQSVLQDQNVVTVLLLLVQTRSLITCLSIELLSMGFASLPRACALPPAPHNFVLSTAMDGLCFSSSIRDAREVVELRHHCISGNILLNISCINYGNEMKSELLPLFLLNFGFSQNALVLVCPRLLSQSKLLLLQSYASHVLGCAVNKCIVILPICVMSWDYVEHWFELLAGAIQLDVSNEEELQLIPLHIMCQLLEYTKEDISAILELPTGYGIFEFMRSELVMFNSSHQFISFSHWCSKILALQCLNSDIVQPFLGTLLCFVGSIKRGQCKCLEITQIRKEAITQNSEQQGLAGYETSRLWISEWLLLGNHDLQLLWDPGGFVLKFPATPSQPWRIIVFKLQCRSNSTTFQHVFSWCFQIHVQVATSQIITDYWYGLPLTKDGDYRVSFYIREHVSWDPGGFMQLRLGGKPCFKEGGMSRTLGCWAGQSQGTWAGSLLAHGSKREDHTNMATPSPGRLVEGPDTEPGGCKRRLESRRAIARG